MPMAALAIGFDGLVALLDAGITAGISLPAAFLAAVAVKEGLVAVAGRALQVGLGLAGMGLAHRPKGKRS